MVNTATAIQFKLADLGVAKLLTQIDAANTRAQWMLPPETLRPQEFGPIDHRIDICHTGLLFLQLAHGKEYTFTQEEVLQGKPRELALTLPPPYNFALEKSLRRHAASRTFSAMEMWRDLQALQPASFTDSTSTASSDCSATLAAIAIFPLPHRQDSPAFASLERLSSSAKATGGQAAAKHGKTWLPR